MSHISLINLSILFSETFSLGLFFLLEHSPSAADDETLNNDPLEKKEITTKFSTTPNRGTLQPKLQPLTVYHGRITCQICFVSSDKRNIKRRNFQKLTTFVDLKKLQKSGKKLIVNTIK